VINERLVKEKKLTSLFAKKYIITRKKIKIDEKVKEEELYPRKEINHLNQEGVVKLGSEVGEKSILVSKRIPCKQKEEELFLTSISGEEYYSFKDSSFYLPRGEKTGIVYKVDH
jgi:DNA-directed RNA polymerase beta subunit